MYLKCRRFVKKKSDKKDRVSQVGVRQIVDLKLNEVVDLKFAKNVKEKKKKKMRVGQSCVFE